MKQIVVRKSGVVEYDKQFLRWLVKLRGLS